MLINEWGVKSEDEITQLDEHRLAPDPKNRETMTALLQASLAPVTRTELMTTPVTPDADVVSMDAPTARDDGEAHSDVA